MYLIRVNLFYSVLYFCVMYHIISFLCNTLKLMHHWDPHNCPDFRDILNLGAVLYRLELVSVFDVYGVLFSRVSALSDSTVYCIINVTSLQSLIHTTPFLFY